MYAKVVEPKVTLKKSPEKKERIFMNIYGKLNKIQTELKAPKGQMNKFGGYKYRSTEDIMEAVKPLLAETKTILTVSDEVVLIGERYYVQAVATLRDCEEEGQISNTAFAREEESKKGMDGSQVTGASSSYARKYALNGLFAIDDTKDSDATNTHGKEETVDTQADMPESERVDATKQINKIQAEAIKALAEKTNSDVAALCKHYGVASLDALNIQQWMDAKKIMEKKQK